LVGFVAWIGFPYQDRSCWHWVTTHPNTPWTESWCVNITIKHGEHASMNEQPYDYRFSRNVNSRPAKIWEHLGWGRFKVRASIKNLPSIWRTWI
jgi:hypothetical protein